MASLLEGRNMHGKKGLDVEGPGCGTKLNLNSENHTLDASRPKA